MYTPGLLLVGLSLISVSTDAASKTPFPFILEEEHHAVAGRVLYDAHRGSRVKAIPEKSPETNATEDERFLRLVRRLVSTQKTSTPMRFDISGMTKIPTPAKLTSQTKPPSVPVVTIDTGSPHSLLHTIHKRSTGNTFITNQQTRRDWSSVEGIVTHKTNRVSVGTIAPKPVTNIVTPEKQMTSNITVDEDETLVFEVMETDLFYIDEENYIAVANSSTFQEYQDIEFYVYLSNQNGDVLSTPLAFIVYIDQPGETNIDSNPDSDTDYPAAPAIFAGVLVLFIVFLALFIPFVTRAKRRYKQGKPVFKMGSHPSMAELETAAVLPRVVSREPNWYGNNTLFSYEEEVQKERSEFTNGIKRLSKKSKEPPKLQLQKKVKDTSSSASSVSETGGSTQDDTKYDVNQRL